MNDRSVKTSDNALHVRYRPDIDGLRAIAVVAVVASHLQVHALEGGYVGVDIFFVISGYLIGSSLLREVALRGRINYADFYERRIRRIMPALAVMLLVVSAFAYALLLPKDLLDFSKMGVATLLFSANLYLSRSSGYFGPEARTNLLTHTWSLGVEEQFYILLPLLLMLFRRAIVSERIGRVLLWMAGLSFVASVVLVHPAPTATFYLLPTRTWELLLGTLTYVYADKMQTVSKRWQNLLAICGLLLIVASIVLYTDQTTFPGLAALPPCLGAVLLIATESTVVSGMLSGALFVWIGQISYSLYLWHWPILVYYHLFSSPKHHHLHLIQAGLFATFLMVAYVSWRWVETPFRRGRFRPGRRTLFWSAASLSALQLLAFGAVLGTGGAVYRFAPREQQIASYRQTGGSMERFRVGQCFVEEPSATNLPERSACLTLDPSRPNYLLLGSSFVAQFYDALQQTYPEVHFLQATSPRCAVQLPSKKEPASGCAALMRSMFDDFLVHNHVDAVFFQVQTGEPTLDELRSVLAYFKERRIRVYVMGPQVWYDRPGPAMAISAIRAPATFHAEDYLMEHSESDDAAYRAVTEQGGGLYLSMLNLLCPHGQCRILVAPDVPMETDQVHLSYDGTLYVAKAWRASSKLLPQGRF